MPLALTYTCSRVHQVLVQRGLNDWYEEFKGRGKCKHNVVTFNFRGAKPFPLIPLQNVSELMNLAVIALLRVSQKFNYV